MEMEEACIVSNCLTMQASSFAGRFFCFTRPPGLRTKTEFIGFAGRRTQTVSAPGPHVLIFRPGGSRKETEFIGFAGSQARTAPAPGPPFLIFRPGVRARKPNSLALREVRREPRRHPGRLF